MMLRLLGRRPPETKPRASQKQLVDKLKYRNRVIRKTEVASERERCCETRFTYCQHMESENFSG